MAYTLDINAKHSWCIIFVYQWMSIEYFPIYNVCFVPRLEFQWIIHRFMAWWMEFSIHFSYHHDMEYRIISIEFDLLWMETENHLKNHIKLHTHFVVVRYFWPFFISFLSFGFWILFKSNTKLNRTNGWSVR